MNPRIHRTNLALVTLFAIPVFLLPELALAQASPFMTGATALQTNIHVSRRLLSCCHAIASPRQPCLQGWLL